MILTSTRLIQTAATTRGIGNSYMSEDFREIIYQLPCSQGQMKQVLDEIERMNP